MAEYAIHWLRSWGTACVRGLGEATEVRHRVTCGNCRRMISKHETWEIRRHERMSVHPEEVEK